MEETLGLWILLLWPHGRTCCVSMMCMCMSHICMAMAAHVSDEHHTCMASAHVARVWASLPVEWCSVRSDAV